MVNLSELDNLIKLLKTHGVSRFRDNTLELSFAQDIPPQEIPLQAPVDLSTDPITSMDDILHWSVGEKTNLNVAGDDPIASHQSEDSV